MAITKEEIVKALHRGVRSASKSYSRWSDGITLENSPEYVAVVEIARNIHTKLGESEFLRLEMRYADVLIGAGFSQGQGAPLKAIKGGKKADLVLLRGKRTKRPTCVIEVKKNPQYKALGEDLKRLRDVVYACRHNRGVSTAFLVVYQSGDSDVVGSIETFLRNQPLAGRKRARVGRPNLSTWGSEASIVVEVRPPRDD